MASQSWIPKRCVMVVDDDRRHRLALCDLLASRRYEVLQAASGGEALAILNRRAVDLVLLDLVMPTMDGLETLHGIRRHSRSIAVIMIGALGTPALERQVLDAGAHAWLDKPVREDALSVALLSLAAPSGFADS
jgi:CheY-like chemotaxis protein